MPSFDLTNRVALVTGASQGLGKAAAVELARAGASIVAVAREPEEVTVGRARPHAPVMGVVEEIKGLDRPALGITADVREEDQVTAMVAQAMDEYGRIDILVNVVGGSWGETFKSGQLMTLDPHDVMEVYRLNVLTMFMVSKAVQPIMKAQGKGCIINIASEAGRKPSPAQPAYAAAKAGVINLTLSMASDWAPEIRSNVIALGGIETPHRPMWAGQANQQAISTERAAMARLGKPEEHAGTIVWLASDYAGFMNGAVIDAHGGVK